MKQFTTPEQTAKLIELGFDKPSNTVYTQVAKRKMGVGIIEWEDTGEEGSYSIGELIEILPENLNDWQLLMHYSTHFYKWCVYYLCDGDTSELYLRLSAQEDELIDALYEMVVKLKEEGVI